MLTVIHRVEELVLVDESPDDEIEQAKKQHKPGARQDTVHNANYENEYGLREVEAIAKDRRLDQFCVIYILNQQLPESLFDIQLGLIPRGVLAPIKKIGYIATLPNSSNRKGNRPSP